MTLPSAPVAARTLVYDQPINIDASNDSHAMMLRMIGGHCRVLEYGCSTGRMTRALSAAGCQVTGLEIDSAAADLARPYAQAVHVIDLDQERASELLAGEHFDVLVFGDVLEHLRDPATTFNDALKLLAPQGRVVVSLPNMAHADVRLALLLEGQVPYAEWGLLDRTHLRWFTRDSMISLFSDAGLEVFEWQRTVREIGETEIPYDRNSVPADLRNWLTSQQDITTYQFVVQAHRRDESDSESARQSTAVNAPVAKQQKAMRLSHWWPLGRLFGNR